MSDWFEDLNDAQLECRQWRHNWDIPNIKVRSFPNGNTGQLLKCKRCEGYRYDVIDRWGEIISRDYDMPDGYYQPKDAIPGSAPTMAELRLISLERRKRLTGAPRGAEASRFGRRVARLLGGDVPALGAGETDD